MGQHNNLFAVVQGFDAITDRIMLRLPGRSASIKVKRGNVQFPAQCPECHAEVTSSACFSCSSGHNTHEFSQRINPAAKCGDSVSCCTASPKHGIAVTSYDNPSASRPS